MPKKGQKPAEQDEVKGQHGHFPWLTGYPYPGLQGGVWVWLVLNKVLRKSSRCSFQKGLANLSDPSVLEWGACWDPPLSQPFSSWGGEFRVGGLGPRLAWEAETLLPSRACDSRTRRKGFCPSGGPQRGSRGGTLTEIGAPHADRRRRWQWDHGQGRRALDPGSGPGAQRKPARGCTPGGWPRHPPVTCGRGAAWPGPGRADRRRLSWGVGGAKAVNQNGDFFWRRRRQERGAGAGRGARRGGSGRGGGRRAGARARPLRPVRGVRVGGAAGAGAAPGSGPGARRLPAAPSGTEAGRGPGPGRGRTGTRGAGSGRRRLRAALRTCALPPLPPLTVLLWGGGGELSRYSCSRSATGRDGSGRRGPVGLASSWDPRVHRVHPRGLRCKLTRFMAHRAGGLLQAVG